MSDTLDLNLRDDLRSLELSILFRIQDIIKDRRLEGHCIPRRSNGLLADYDGITFSRKEMDLFCLLLLCEFSDIFGDFVDYILYEVWLDLKHTRSFPIIAAAIQERDLMLEILTIFYHEKYDDTKILYRAILNPQRVEKVINTTRLKILKPRKPKQKVRRRGYNDHGSRRPDDRWLESYDRTFTEAQNSIEKKRQEYQDLVELLINLTRIMVSQKLN